MLRVTVFILIISLALSQIADNPLYQDKQMYEKYKSFMKTFNKTYSTFDEMQKRFKCFCDNMKKAEMMSSKQNKSYQMGMTKFMDITPEEFGSKYLNKNMTNVHLSSNTTKKNYSEIKNKNGRFLQNIPASWDWRDHGAVNPIQNQGECGGCWAFSAVANLETLYYRKYGVLPKFSEQQLIDCDGSNSGCSGGLMGPAMDYVQTYGLQSAATYEYENYQGYCRQDRFQSTSFLTGWIQADSDDEEYIKEMLYTMGPLSVTINANSLMYYTGGVYAVGLDECPYNPTHGVNLVGYGTDEWGTDYWIVRNTWGEDWGEYGYFRLARGYGLCGINAYVVSGVAE